MACDSFASTDAGVVAGCFTEAADGLIQVFLRAGGGVEEVLRRCLVSPHLVQKLVEESKVRDLEFDYQPRLDGRNRR